jgi:adenosylmethionine-8-amino-7-oxononanoate aminotransferase
MYDRSYLTLLREACDRYQVHLIADEIAVGFGRTGTFFASEQGPISPDFLCLSKGLTGGYLPLSAVLTTTKVYEAFYAEYHEGRAFLHSHSYTGNPLACRVALASIQLFDGENTLVKNRHLATLMAKAVSDLTAHPHVAEVRQKGMILAIEMAQDGPSKTLYPANERRGQKAYREALRHGVLLRPLGDVLYFMPPYVIQSDEIEQMAQAARAAVQVATA